MELMAYNPDYVHVQRGNGQEELSHILLRGGPIALKKRPQGLKMRAKVWKNQRGKEEET